MALTLFLFKVSNLDIPDPTLEFIDEDEDQSILENPTKKATNNENATFLSARVTFRGIVGEKYEMIEKK